MLCDASRSAEQRAAALPVGEYKPIVGYWLLCSPAYCDTDCPLEGSVLRFRALADPVAKFQGDAIESEWRFSDPNLKEAKQYRHLATCSRPQEMGKHCWSQSTSLKK